MRRRSSRLRPRCEAVGSSHTGSTFDRPLLDPAVPLACWHGPAKCIGRAFWAPANLRPPGNEVLTYLDIPATMVSAAEGPMVRRLSGGEMDSKPRFRARGPTV